jgi:hypothetical protein
MRYLIGILISLIIYINFSYSDNQFIIYFNILLCVLLYLLIFLQEYSVFDKNYESDFKIQSQKKLPNFFHLGLITFWTLLIYLGNFKNPTKVFLILSIYTSFILELIMFFLYKKKKPYTLFIKNNELILLERGNQKRDLIGLNRILFDRFNKNIEFTFDKGFKLKINTINYKKEDIDELLDIVIEKSKHPVFIPKNYLEEKRK